MDPTQPNGVYDDLVARWVANKGWFDTRQHTCFVPHTVAPHTCRVSKPVDPKSLPAKRKHLVLIVSDSLRQKDWHNTSAPRMHAMCEQREDCFMSPQHYANAWGSDQGMFTLWYAGIHTCACALEVCHSRCGVLGSQVCPYAFPL